MPTIDPLPFPDVERLATANSRAFELQVRYADLGTSDLLHRVIQDEFPQRLALVSSFGAESAALLHMVAGIDPSLPVILLDTGKLFGETLRYRDRLIEDLKLTNVRSVKPDPAQLQQEDADGLLYRRDPNRCCFIRKVEPLRRTLAGFEAWITGRKAFQSKERAGLPLFESDGQRIKINPLAYWRKEALVAYFARHGLPRHPLESDGFLSIGCMPCTERVAPGEQVRGGRWRGFNKTECGIHQRWGH